MKLTLTYVKSEQRMSARTNKPYTSQSLKSTEYGDRFLSGFGSKETADWKVGDVVEVEVKESDKMDKNNKPYLNWSLVKAENPLVTRISAIEFSIANIHRKIEDIVSHIKMKENNGLTSAGTPVPTFVVNTPEQSQNFESQMKQYEEKNHAQLYHADDLNGELNALAEELI